MNSPCKNTPQLEEKELKMFKGQMFKVFLIVLTLFTLIVGMKIGVELSNARIIKECDSKHLVKIRDINYECRRS